MVLSIQQGGVDNLVLLKRKSEAASETTRIGFEKKTTAERSVLSRLKIQISDIPQAQ